jgi:hypothetical protein
MAHASTSHETPASASTTTRVVDVLEEFEDCELDADFVAHVEDPISSSGDEFDD